MYKSNWAAKFYARLISSTLEQGHITYLCSRFNALMSGRSVHGVAYDDRGLAFEEAKCMVNACKYLKPKCTPDHAAGGLKFLWDTAFTPKGNTRKTAKSQQLRPNDWIMLQDCKHKGDYEIHLTGFVPVGDGYAPEYRLSRVDPWKGLWCLHYIMTPWQSGGYFEVTQHV